MRLVLKRILRYFWQLLLFPLLYIPYDFLNTIVLVEWLGCVCPRVDEQGIVMENRFNANDFTLLFWTGIALIVVGVSVFQCRKIKTWPTRLLYLAANLLLSILFVWNFIRFMQWR